MQAYIDEQVFKFNNRATKDNPLNDSDRFVAALAQVAGKRLTYKELTGKTARSGSNDARAFLIPIGRSAVGSRRTRLRAAFRMLCSLALILRFAAIQFPFDTLITWRRASSKFSVRVGFMFLPQSSL